MDAPSEKRQLKIYCPQHQTIFEVEEGPKIVCEILEHSVSSNFPYSEFWEYCCDCRTFSPSGLEVGSSARSTCMHCERMTVGRFICEMCKVVSFDSVEDTKGKTFTIDAKNGPDTLPCPGCQAVVSGEKLHLHECPETGSGFFTRRKSCPFCQKEVFQEKKPAPVVPKPKSQAAPVFPILAKTYLERVRSSASTGTFDAVSGLLVEDPQKGNEFLIIESLSPNGNAFYALPGIDHFQTRNEYDTRYQSHYRCQNPSGGAIWIVSPAIIERTDGGWWLIREGELIISNSRCWKCNSENLPYSVFCSVCGASLAAGDEVPSEPTPAPSVPPVPANQPAKKKGSSGRSGLIAAGTALLVVIACCAIYRSSSSSNDKTSTGPYNGYPSYNTSPRPTSAAPTYTPTTNTNTSKPSNANTSSPRSTSQDFTRTFAGSINGTNPVEMRLEKSGSSLSGKVFTRNVYADISVSGSIEDDGSFELGEYDDMSNQTGAYDGRIYPDGTVKGHWSKPDGSNRRSFFLREK